MMVSAEANSCVEVTTALVEEIALELWTRRRSFRTYTCAIGVLAVRATGKIDILHQLQARCCCRAQPRCGNLQRFCCQWAHRRCLPSPALIGPAALVVAPSDPSGQWATSGAKAEGPWTEKHHLEMKQHSHYLLKAWSCYQCPGYLLHPSLQVPQPDVCCAPAPGPLVPELSWTPLSIASS